MRSTRLGELLTTDEVAERLGVKPALLRTWRFRGKGPKCVNLGRQLMYRESDLIKWMEEQEKSA